MKFKALILALAAPAAYANVTLIPNANLFWDVTVVNGVPITVGTNSAGYTYLVGTDAANITGFGGNNSGTGRCNISEDGTKISGNINSAYTFLDGLVHSAIGRYDRTTSTWTEFGHLNYYGSSGTKEASNAWGMSGDGNTVAGQGYYQTTAPGSSSARANAMVATASGGTNLYPTIANNGRCSAVNYDGTVAAGWREGTAPNYTWVKTGGVWGAPQLVSAMVSGVPTNLTVTSDMDGEGRFLLGHGGVPGKLWVYDRINSTAELITPPVAGTITAFCISKAGDMVTYRVLPQFGNLYADSRTYVWTRETGSVQMNALVDGFGVDRQTASLNNLWGMSPDGEWHVGYSWTTINMATIVHASTNFRGTAALGDYVAPQNEVPVNFTLKDSGGTTVSTWTSNLGPSGRFLKMLAPTLATGQYRLYAKASHWLTKAVSFDHADRGMIGLGTLTNGDVVGDDIIDIADYTALAAAFGAQLDEDENTAGNQSSANWNPEANLDGNTIVDIADYVILSSNFSAVGDI